MGLLGVFDYTGRRAREISKQYGISQDIVEGDIRVCRKNPVYVIGRISRREIELPYGTAVFHAVDESPLERARRFLLTLEEVVFGE